MANDSEHDQMVEQVWRSFLTKGHETEEFKNRHLFGVLPSNPRCRLCNAPFGVVGGTVMRMLYDKRKSRLNPHICNL